MASRPVNLAYGGGAAKKNTSPPPEAGLTAPPLRIGDPANFCATATDKNIDVVFKRLTAGKKPAAIPLQMLPYDLALHGARIVHG